jgi:hypothetical protein
LSRPIMPVGAGEVVIKKGNSKNEKESQDQKLYCIAMPP